PARRRRTSIVQGTQVRTPLDWVSVCGQWLFHTEHAGIPVTDLDVSRASSPKENAAARSVCVDTANRVNR
ncbi:hypothetical protein ATN81_27660, partial [Agrobacterium pusense]|uniref:hypothetical protein n=1 Tax=Agrobacterium pusense TaxID=648995 RepID=UPI00092C5B5E